MTEPGGVARSAASMGVATAVSRAIGFARILVIAAVLGTVAVAVLATDFRELIDDAELGPAWGLYVAFVGSAVLVACSMSLLARR